MQQWKYELQSLNLTKQTLKMSPSWSNCCVFNTWTGTMSPGHSHGWLKSDTATDSQLSGHLTGASAFYSDRYFRNVQGFCLMGLKTIDSRSETSKRESLQGESQAVWRWSRYLSQTICYNGQNMIQPLWNWIKTSLNSVNMSHLPLQRKQSTALCFGILKV